MKENSINENLASCKKLVLPSLTHGSLFSGIGGFDLAAEWVGWENKFHCEWNDFGKRILKYYWPKAISYDDITKTDFTIHRGTIDVLTGGFPCQPYSVAGKRKGKEDERHLWPEMLRAIREIEPRYIVGENVYGIINWNGGLVFEEVQTDLENAGYKVQTFVLPAASVNAPHKRERIWFIAFKNSNKNRWTCNQWKTKPKTGKQRNSCSRNNEQLCAYNDEVKNFTDTESESSRRKHKQRQKQREFGGCNCKNDASYTECKRRREILQKIQQKKSNGKGFNAFNEPNSWEKFPTETPICDGDDGLSSRLDAITFPKWRSESIKGGGNAIVPQVVLQIFKAIAMYDDSLSDV
ncbi:DNA cytosine methyltransferase [Flavobacterium algicola]|uniref:DNA cytosine methyltransferase n=1 Tax=Flavobacterium algicola TaxID=556529 RepID=UPI001EFDDDDB|nr:DNA (cytosine-5-)-methyltransferase [Flavobacterium algicola]MCG9792499.1 DNA (cytosine-5-)-methyltransferase [Flavobacterium algicola]